jgi:hypothetical protein
MPSKRTTRRAVCITWILLAMVLSTGCAFASDLRLGIIGTDTSHVIEFTKLLNDPTVPGHVSGAVVVAAVKGGSPDIPISRDRVEGFSKELKEKWHVQFVSKISDLCPMVDGILLESVDGRAHLEQFRQAALCGKPIYIEKPLASTLSDALQIAQIAAAHKIQWFSSSSLRFGLVQAMRAPDTAGVLVWGPGPFEPLQQLDLSWYAIHPIEILFTLMGPDVQQVTRTYSPNADVITGIWKGGRIGTVRANRPYGSFGAVVFHSDNNEPTLYSNIEPGYSPLLRAIVKFMQTGIPPVPNEETMKIYEFMDAAQQSREHGGVPVDIAR